MNFDTISLWESFKGTKVFEAIKGQSRARVELFANSYQVCCCGLQIGNEMIKSLRYCQKKLGFLIVAVLFILIFKL